MSAMICRKITGYAPVNEVIDLIAAYPGEFKAMLPQFMGFAYWVEVPDAGATGSVIMNINYLDPGGVSEQIGGSFIQLNNTGFVNGCSFRSPVQIIQRFDATSQFELDIQLSFGSAGSALLGYTILLSDGDSENVYFFNN